MRGEPFRELRLELLKVDLFFEARAFRLRGVSRKVRVSMASCGRYPSSHVSLTSSMFSKSSFIFNLL